MKYEKGMFRRYAREIACIVFCLAVVACVRLSGYRSGKTISVKSERHFDRAMRHAELAVIMFYEKDKRMSRSNRPMWRVMERLERMFESVGRTARYREVGMRFILINGSRGDLGDMFYNYHIKDIPTFMLFENGRPVKQEYDDTQGDIRVSGRVLRERDGRVELVGDVSPEQLRDFIEDHLGSRIDCIIEDRAEARRWAAENRFYAWPYWGWGWGRGPYYYWNYPYYGYYSPWWY